MILYKENNSSSQEFLIASFFTLNYKDKADRLIESLKNLKLNYKIFEIPSIHFSKSNNGSDDINFCQPKLILDLIKQFNIPILFVDSDMVFCQKPTLIYKLKDNDIDFAIYNHLEDSENDGYLPLKLKVKIPSGETDKIFYINSFNDKRINNANKEKQLISSGAVSYFSNSNSSKLLLKKWLGNIKSYPKAPDDQLLDFTFNVEEKIRQNLNVKWFDKSYCRISWWIFSKPIINHPDKLTDRKIDFYEVTGKKRFNVENTDEITDRKIGKDLIIDIQDKLILRVKDKKLYVVKKLDENIYI